MYVIYFYLLHMVHMPRSQFQTFRGEEPNSFIALLVRVPTTGRSTTSLSSGLEFGLAYSW